VCIIKKIIKALLGNEEVERLEVSIIDGEPSIDKVVIKKGFNRDKILQKLEQELEKVLSNESNKDTM